MVSIKTSSVTQHIVGVQQMAVLGSREQSTESLDDICKGPCIASRHCDADAGRAGRWPVQAARWLPLHLAAFTHPAMWDGVQRAQRPYTGELGPGQRMGDQPMK